jgi:hypothetical protein
MRRKQIVIVIVIFLLAAGVAISYYFFEKTSPAFKEGTTAELNSSVLKKTIITPHMEQEIIAGKNIIYCSTFQLAWNELKDGIVKEDIKMTDEPPMVKILNKGLSTKADLSEKDYVAMAGFGKDSIIEKINKELMNKFKEEATPIEYLLEPNDVMAYSFLYKNLEFMEEFESITEPLIFHSEGRFSSIKSKVKAFGIDDCYPCIHRFNWLEFKKQIEILYYPSDREIINPPPGKPRPLNPFSPDVIDFVVRLKTKSPEDEILLAKINPEATLQKTIKAVQELIKDREPEFLEENRDQLKIPKLYFNIGHKYEPLRGKSIQNKIVKGSRIGEATQVIKFKLDEKGAVLKSEARSPAMAAAIPKQLIFNRPFLIYLKNKNGEWPYFAMWVANPELMKKP